MRFLRCTAVGGSVSTNAGAACDKKSGNECRRTRRTRSVPTYRSRIASLSWPCLRCGARNRMSDTSWRRNAAYPSRGSSIMRSLGMKNRLEMRVTHEKVNPTKKLGWIVLSDELRAGEAREGRATERVSQARVRREREREREGGKEERKREDGGRT